MNCNFKFNNIKGDSFLHAFVMRILRRVSTPLFDMMSSWVFEGEFSDPHGEFFIVNKIGQANDKMTMYQNSTLDLWREGYEMNEEMLPSFITKTLANKILRAGKSINFLRQHL